MLRAHQIMVDKILAQLRPLVTEMRKLKAHAQILAASHDGKQGSQSSDLQLEATLVTDTQ